MNAIKAILGLLNGKKSFGLNIVSIITLVWALLSPATAPSEQTLNQVIDQGTQVVEVVNHEVLPLLVVLIANVLSLLTGLHSQSKIAMLLQALGVFLGKHLDVDDVARIQKQLKNGGVVQVGKSDVVPPAKSP